MYGSAGARHGDDADDYVHASLSSTFKCSNVASYQIISGNVSVSHSGDNYTFSLSASNSGCVNNRTWIYATQNGVVEITFA